MSKLPMLTRSAVSIRKIMIPMLEVHFEGGTASSADPVGPFSPTGVAEFCASVASSALIIPSRSGRVPSGSPGALSSSVGAASPAGSGCAADKSSAPVGTAGPTVPGSAGARVPSSAGAAVSGSASALGSGSTGVTRSGSASTVGSGSASATGSGSVAPAGSGSAAATDSGSTGATASGAAGATVSSGAAGSGSAATAISASAWAAPGSARSAFAAGTSATGSPTSRPMPRPRSHSTHLPDQNSCSPKPCGPNGPLIYSRGTPFMCTAYAYKSLCLSGWQMKSIVEETKKVGGGFTNASPGINRSRPAARERTSGDVTCAAKKPAVFSSSQSFGSIEG
mmetsp:Transcript_46677/g.107882  ORF Transcript_46677/g.107882 Transcript_46677/m.107882 type:complete len:338 (-) Transcript_46677:557-1570(-)